MSVRELVVLGTAAQAPTRDRNHNGYLLRWDDEGFLFDPGEGTQRQLLLAGESSSRITRICVTHFHGDHCLGLPGVFARMALDGVSHPVDVYFPREGREHYDRLRLVSAADEGVEIRGHPSGPGTVAWTGKLTLSARRLDHRVETLGWRLEEPTGRRMLPDRLAELGVHGSDIGRLQREGSLTLATRRVDLGQVSVARPGQRFAFVMDTALCEAAFALAESADLLVCEATYLSEHADLARRHKHLTAAEAGRIAAEAGARRLVLTHFSQRYGDAERFAAEAGEVFDDVVVASDLARIPLPPRR